MGGATQAAMARLDTAVLAHFTAVHRDRMQDVPLLNPRLQVASTGFRYHDGHAVGVIVTPWLMKLLALPLLPAGEPPAQRRFVFPSGPYTMTLEQIEAIGGVYGCSLFSPMQEFADQEAALATATAVLEALFQEPEEDRSKTRVMDRRHFLRGALGRPGG